LETRLFATKSLDKIITHSKGEHSIPTPALNNTSSQCRHTLSNGHVALLHKLTAKYTIIKTTYHNESFPHPYHKSMKQFYFDWT